MIQLVVIISSLIFLISGCGGENSVQSVIGDSQEGGIFFVDAQRSYNQSHMDGSRWVLGAGRFPQVPYVEVDLEGRPQWIVAAPTGLSSIWVVVLEDGSVQGFRV